VHLAPGPSLPGMVSSGPSGLESPHGLISPVSSCLTWGAGGVVGQDPGCSSHISLVSPWSFRDVDSLPQGHIQTCKLHDQRVCAGHLLGPGDLGQPHHTLSLDWPPLGGTQQVVSSHQSPGSDRLFPRHLGPCRVRVSLVFSWQSGLDPPLQVHLLPLPVSGTVTSLFPPHSSAQSSLLQEDLLIAFSFPPQPPQPPRVWQTLLERSPEFCPPVPISSL
jgi:hypothetical protein